MLHRLRLALRNGDWVKMGGSDGGPVEIDETYIGPKPRKMHNKRRLARKSALDGSLDMKTPVMGMLDRESRKVRAAVVPNVKRETLQNAILEGVEKDSVVFTDQSSVYYNLAAREYLHATINHTRGIRERPGSHPGNRQLLESVETGIARHIRCGRAVPSRPLFARANVLV